MRIDMCMCMFMLVYVQLLYTKIYICMILRDRYTCEIKIILALGKGIFFFEENFVKGGWKK